MSIESEKNFKRRSGETFEGRAESREKKENEIDSELQAAASMERADYLVKEVKNSKQQMQNILLHIQQVKQAIQQIRAQLQLQAKNDDDDSSVKQDKEMVNKLKEKIVEYKDELIKMRDDLVREQIEQLKNGVGVGMAADDLKKKAEVMVDEMICDM